MVKWDGDADQATAFDEPFEVRFALKDLGAVNRLISTDTLEDAVAVMHGLPEEIGLRVGGTNIFSVEEKYRVAGVIRLHK